MDERRIQAMRQVGYEMERLMRGIATQRCAEEVATYLDNGNCGEDVVNEARIVRRALTKWVDTLHRLYIEALDEAREAGVPQETLTALTTIKNNR